MRAISFGKKKRIYVFVWALLVNFIFLGVQAEANTPCGISKVVALYAGQSIDVGTVSVYHDGENLYVKYNTGGSWALSETHLAIATSFDGIPQTQEGGCKLGSFTYKTLHESVKEYLYVINLNEAGYKIGSNLYIAAHADVVLLDQYDEIIQEEGAWADGNKFPISWATYFTYTLPPCLGKIDTNIQLQILQDIGILSTELTVTTFLSTQKLTEGQSTVTAKFADVNKGQIFFIENSSEDPFIVAYLDFVHIQNGYFSLTIDAIVDGLVMTNPLMMGYKQDDRLIILETARNDKLYQQLKEEIVLALKIEPYNLLNVAIFPKIYEYSSILIIKAIESFAAATKQIESFVYNDASLDEPVIVGEENTPYFMDITGEEISIVNPTMIFYGFDIDRQSQKVISGKESVWELKWGWPPTFSFTEPVTETANLGDGNFDIQFSKFGLVTSAKMMAGAANFLKGSCEVLDVFFFCPASNETIENFVEFEPLGTLGSAINDIISTETVEEFLDELIEVMLDKDVWHDITRAIYNSSVDKEAAVKFLKNAKKLLKAADAILKILEAHDAANVKIPFFWNLLLMPNEINFCVKQVDGVLEATCQYIPPVANINKVSPDEVFVQNLVTFDASASADDLDDTSLLKVRWDFNGDGIFDTEWSTDKLGDWAYQNVGSYNVKLEVEDLDGLIGKTYYTVAVKAETAGGTANHIKLFRDNLPWDTTSFESIMVSHGYSQGPGEFQYEILSSNEMASEILYPGQDFVVIANDQDQNFYNNLAQNLDRIDRFVKNGGVLLWGACDLGWHNGSMAAAGITLIPGDVQFGYFYDSTNYNVNPQSELMYSLPANLTGTYASHEHFFNIPPEAIIYMEDTLGHPTLMEYRHGNGWIMLTGQPLEYNVVYNSQSMGLVYPRLFNYILGNINKEAGIVKMIAISPESPETYKPSHIE